jgi:isopropylmalate/homocitrate/citramalate synthase
MNARVSPLAGIPTAVRVVEVGPRDGLQNEAGLVPTETKVAFIEALAAAGAPVIEATSFVRADRVPQLGDAEEIFARLRRLPGTRYVALVPNPKGLERALGAGVSDIAVFTAASETFNRKNINRTIAESLADIRAVAGKALAAGLRVRGYVSTAFGCPYEGRIDEKKVRDVVLALIELGIDEVSVGDTIGVATPADIERVTAALLPRIPAERLALHLHDTRGTALANILVGLELGIATFDSSAGGLGGCPYAPGASGNVATEDVLYLLHGLGVKTGVDLDRLAAASALIARALGRKLPSRVHQAPPWPQR